MKKREKLKTLVIAIPKFLDSNLDLSALRFLLTTFVEMTNLDFLPMIHPDASGGTFRIYRKKKQEIHDEDTIQ